MQTDNITEYDSSVDTLLHIKRLNELIIEACQELLQRAKVHDNSKLQEPEKGYFDKYTPELAAYEYGSKEYMTSLEKLQPALDHHYAKNSHHPQHFDDGIDGMNLFDVMEMFFDWKAASERHDTGNICKSIKANKKRYNMSEQLTNIFENTVKYLGY